MDIEKRMNDLIKEINYHNEKYYNQDQPEISDYDYDTLMRELISIEEEHPELKKSGFSFQ